MQVRAFEERDWAIGPPLATRHANRGMGTETQGSSPKPMFERLSGMERFVRSITSSPVSGSVPLRHSCAQIFIARSSSGINLICSFVCSHVHDTFMSLNSVHVSTFILQNLQVLI